jgi:hypothetical protein
LTAARICRDLPFYFKEPIMIEPVDIKLAVLKVALGIKALEDKDLFETLEEFWISAYARGRRDAGSQPTDVGKTGVC